MSSLRSNTPDPDDPSESTLDGQDGHRQGPLMALGSLDDDDPNILLAIQLSLQDSAMAGGTSHEFLANEASLGAIGTSLPSRLEQSAPSVEVLPRASLSSSELLELGDNLARLGNINITSQYSAGVSTTVVSQHCESHHRSYGGSVPIPVAPGGSNSSTGLFSSSSDTIDSTTCGSHDPSSSSAAAANANLLGNIMAWFHDMNPQGITLVPSTSTDTDTDLDALHPAGGGCPQDDEKTGVFVLPENTKPQEGLADVGFCPQRPGDLEEKESAVTERPTQLDLVGLDAMTLPYMAALDTSGDHVERGGAKVCHVDTPRCDSVSDQLPSSSSSEWEEQVHLV
ncbi:ankyrin repeat and IBR domain-containing protein 1-like [Centroberyx affinis]|uniref:ankyrin repeat and IBR domain-containing protein 1-like n=1 Tax=Centroberyx affinis TaxID=166261 RepID=UPI003A5BECF5